MGVERVGGPGPGRTEVEQEGAAVGRDENVARLDVLMEKSFGVDGGEGLHQGVGEIEKAGRVERPVFADDRVEGPRAVDPVGRDIGGAVRDEGESNGEHAGDVEPADGLGLLEKGVAQGGRVGSKVDQPVGGAKGAGRHGLLEDRAISATQVERVVDDGEAAAPEDGADLEPLGDAGALGQGIDHRSSILRVQAGVLLPLRVAVEKAPVATADVDGESP